MEKEQWKDEVMSSLQGMSRAEPNHFLFTRIEERLKSSEAFLSNSIIPLPKLSLVFAGIALLMMLNFFALKNSNNNTVGNAQSTQSPYSLSNINYQLY